MVKAVFQRNLADNFTDVPVGLMRPAPLLRDGFHRLHHRAPSLFTGLQTVARSQFFTGVRVAAG